jgi:polysaccharide biosynthesis protein PslH
MENFLSLVWYKVLPAHYGGQKDIAIFNKYFGEKKYLTCLCSKNNQAEATMTYAVYPLLPKSKWQFFLPAVRKKIRLFIRRHQFTHIILEHPYHAWIYKYRKKLNFKLILHAHNIEFIRMQERKKWWWPLVKYIERTAFKKADSILFKTEKDKEQAIRIFGVNENKCLIVPYGMEMEYQPPANTELKKKIRSNHGIAPAEKIILFAGSLNYEPNIEAIKNISNEIIPLLKQKNGFLFKVIICGRKEEKIISKYADNPDLLFTGFVDSIDEYMQAADVFINPVLSGSGIQTKNIDALANGLSIACTEYAAEGLPAYLAGTKLLTSKNNDWGQFAENIMRLSQNSSPTPRQFYTDFYWGNIIDRTLTKIV